MSTQLGKSLGVRGDTVEAKGAGSAERIGAGGISTDASNDGTRSGPGVAMKSSLDTANAQTANAQHLARPWELRV